MADRNRRRHFDGHRCPCLRVGEWHGQDRAPVIAGTPSRGLVANGCRAPKGTGPSERALLGSFDRASPKLGPLAQETPQNRPSCRRRCRSGDHPGPRSIRNPGDLRRPLGSWDHRWLQDARSWVPEPVAAAGGRTIGHEGSGIATSRRTAVAEEEDGEPTVRCSSTRVSRDEGDPEATLPMKTSAPGADQRQWRWMESCWRGGRINGFSRHEASAICEGASSPKTMAERQPRIRHRRYLVHWEQP